eukprot:3731843-Rhodomonas_salina.1
MREPELKDPLRRDLRLHTDLWAERLGKLRPESEPRSAQQLERPVPGQSDTQRPSQLHGSSRARASVTGTPASYPTPPSSNSPCVRVTQAPRSAARLGPASPMTIMMAGLGPSGPAGSVLRLRLKPH